jgi:hypothetical protein
MHYGRVFYLLYPFSQGFYTYLCNPEMKTRTMDIPNRCNCLKLFKIT